jgi:hypothetical protein
MLSAKFFVECFSSGIRRTISLSSAETKTLGERTTLGKEGSCRVFFLALGKELTLPSVFSGTQANK